MCVGNIRRDLLRSVLRQLEFASDPFNRSIGRDGTLCRPVVAPRRRYQKLFDFHPQIRNRTRKLVGSGGSFAQPKWNSRWLTFCVLDTNHPGIHAHDSPRRVSQLKMSPARLSTAKSSFTVPTKVSDGSRITR